MQAQEYISVEKMAGILKISTNRVGQLIKAGRVPGATKVGSLTRRGVWMIPVGSDGWPTVTPLPEGSRRGPRPTYPQPG